jgi:hypothetical protein
MPNLRLRPVNCIDACKMAYRKHVLNDFTIGWDELCDAFKNALCNEMGDAAFIDWKRYANASEGHSPDCDALKGYPVCTCGLGVR